MPTPFRTFRLANHLRVLLAPLRETQAVTALILCRVGSRYEPAHLNGASHFLEHLTFKGTKKRPTALDISKELDAIGASYNAFTSKDHTGYYVKAAARHLPRVLDVLADILFHSRFDPAEVERERKVVLQEINMYEDNPLLSAEDVFEATIFGRHPLGRLISGPKSVIRRVRRNALLAFREKFYDPSNIFLILAGNIPRSTQALVRQLFREPSQRKGHPTFPRFRARQRRPQTTFKRKDTEQTQLILGFPGYPHEHPLLYPLELLSVILGGNMSSRLFIAIRERQGLCYSIRASVNVYEDTGSFSVHAGLDRTRLRRALASIIRELVRIRQEGLEQGELAKAKEYLKGKFILELEDSEHIAGFFGRQALFSRRIRTPEEVLKKVDRVTEGQVRRVCREIIRSERANLALIGPREGTDALAKLLRFR